MDELQRVAKAELIDDVALHQRGRRRGQRDHRSRTQQRQAFVEHAVLGSKIVAPVRDAVGFVDGDQDRLAPGEHFREARDAEPFGRDEQEVEIAREVLLADPPRLAAVAAGVDPLGDEAARPKLRGLIFHQRDQRTDHQRGAGPGDARQLVAQRLAGAGGHHEQHVAAQRDLAAGLFLVRSEGRQAEGLAQERVEAVGRHRFALEESHRFQGSRPVPCPRPRVGAPGSGSEMSPTEDRLRTAGRLFPAP